MNISINNLKNSLSTQDISNKNKNIDNEKVRGDFKKSLEESKNSSETNCCDKKNSDDDNENLDKLKALVYLIDFVSQNGLKEFTPTVDGTQNFFIRNLVSENGFLPQENLVINKNQLVQNLDSNSENILSELGFDKNKIDFASIDNAELSQKILSNSEGFKSLIKNIISDFEKDDVDFVKNINQILDDGKFLNSDELLKNIKNEISQKINRAQNFEGTPTQSVEVQSTEFKNLNSFSEIKNHNESDNILKEISGFNKENDKNFENYLVNNIRTHNLNANVEVFHKTIDATVQTKFVKEFVESINYMATNNKTEMILKLNPEHLGKMDIKYEVIKDNVRLMIRVEKVEALKIIDSTITDIKNMIKENHQINLDNIQVDLQKFTFDSNGNGSNQNKNFDEDDNQSVQAFNLKLDDEDVPEDVKKRNLRSGILV